QLGERAHPLLLVALPGRHVQVGEIQHAHRRRPRRQDGNVDPPERPARALDEDAPCERGSACRADPQGDPRGLRAGVARQRSPGFAWLPADGSWAITTPSCPGSITFCSLRCTRKPADFSAFSASDADSPITSGTPVRLPRLIWSEITAPRPAEPDGFCAPIVP